jgi:hypothetical protein
MEIYQSTGLNKKIRGINLYRILKILGSEIRELSYGYNLLSSQTWSSEDIYVKH